MDKTFKEVSTLADEELNREDVTMKEAVAQQPYRNVDVRSSTYTANKRNTKSKTRDNKNKNVTIQKSTARSEFQNTHQSTNRKQTRNDEETKLKTRKRIKHTRSRTKRNSK